jgi:Effector Associated Constant Component 1
MFTDMGAESAGETEIRVHIQADDAPGELRSLSGWLNGEDALHGRIRLTSTPPPEGTMGAGLESLLVTVGPGSMATAFGAVVIAWIRSRTGTISIELSRGKGKTMRLDAKNVRALTHDQVSELTDRLSALLPADAAGPDGESGR